MNRLNGTNEKPVIVIGAGGHAKVLIEILRLRNTEIIGLVDSNSATWGTWFQEHPILGANDKVLSYDPAKVLLVNGVGSVGKSIRRSDVFARFKKKGYDFAIVVHPRAIIAADVILDEGVQVMAGAVIQPGCRIGENSVVNTQAAIDHDCLISSHVHISPGAVLCGCCEIEDGAHVGAGATILHGGVRIGENTVIGAGSVVLRDVGPNMTLVGVPAKEVKT